MPNATLNVLMLPIFSEFRHCITSYPNKSQLGVGRDCFIPWAKKAEAEILQAAIRERGSALVKRLG
jgi:hypothetical protein